MENVNAIIDQAEQQCSAHGARLTSKRKEVLAALIESNKALSAYELIDCCREKSGKSIAAMSIYRILEFLEQESLVHKLKLANKYVACAHISCSHDHGTPQFLICANCSKVKEISIKPNTISDLENTVKAADYHLLSPQIEMNCLCSDCTNNAA